MLVHTKALVSAIVAVAVALAAIPAASACSDSDTYTFGTYEYNAGFTTRNCAWLTDNPTESAARIAEWCDQSVGGSPVYNNCPVSCDACSYASCVNASTRLKIVVGGNIVSRSCTWVGRQDTTNRCALAGVSAACPNTCGTCDSCVDTTARFRFTYNGQSIVRNCDFVGRVESKVEGRCAASGYVCRSTCGGC